ncbi:MAG: small multi-drug export protein [Treponema sp.]|nr:small multi-drug export protein [Treponema sp.]
MTKALLFSFLISMVPLVELRGAIPFGVGVFTSQSIPLTPSLILWLFCLCMIGNMIPVPFIFLFARKFLEWGQNKKIIGGMCTFFLEKGHRGGEKLQEKAGRGLYFALFLFVGIPLPGTGAWTGTLAASLLDMDWKKTSLAVICGVLLAGIIMLTLSYGVALGISKA